MKKRCLLLLALILLVGGIWAQSAKIALTPLAFSPSTFTLQTTTAGATPANPVVNYTSQSLKYSWPFLGDNIFGTIALTANVIPSGITITDQAANPGSWAGSTTGLVTVSTSYTDMITGIWYASNKTVTLTQNVYISDFSLLHPGTYVITMTYRIQ
jgi:hypothetical protein